jgi:hypothetical protein
MQPVRPRHRTDRWLLLLVLFSGVAGWACLVQGAGRSGILEPAQGRSFVPDQLVIRTAAGFDLEAGHFLTRHTAELTGDPSLDRLCGLFGLTAAVEGVPLGRSPTDPGGRVFLLTFGGGGHDPRLLQRAFLGCSVVTSAEPNLLFHSFALPPNDTYYGSSGTWKQSYPDLWGLQAIDAALAWALSEGDSPVVIGLVDSGLDFGHPDFGPGIWRNPGEIPDNGLDDEGNGFVDDVWGHDFTIPVGSPGSGQPLDLQGHGTNSFGILSATFDNRYGIPGLAFNCRTMTVKGLGDDGSGTLFDLCRGIQYAVDNGARVLNLGWGAFGTSELLATTIRAADTAGVVVLCAAGNSGLPVAGIIPAGYAETLAVGASEPGGGVYGLSNYGSALDLVAPGIDILTTRAAYSDPAGDGSRFVGNDFFRSAGTSSAVPHAAAAAGLLLARRESLSVDAVRCALRATAVPFPDNKRFSNEAGYGQLHAGNLLALEHPIGLRLTSPRRGMILFGDVPLEISGRVGGKEQFRWCLSWGSGEFPDSFQTLDQAEAPVHGLVQLSASLPTAGLGPGIYTIRLQAWHPASPPVYEERVSLIIDNTRGLLSGTVLSAGTGGPLPAVELTAFHAATLETAAVVRSAADGCYRFEQGLPAGPYFVRAGSGFTDVIPEYFDGAQSLADAQSVEVSAGAETGGIDFSLSRRGSISGTMVRRGTGEPVPGVIVSIYYPAGTLMRETVSGSDGGYGFSNLIEQHYFIGARHAEQRFVPRFYNDRPVIEQATPVAVQNDNDTGGIDLALKQHGGVISGTVRRGSDGLELQGIAVEAAAVGRDFHRQALSGSDGGYLLDDLPSGTYRVSAAGTTGGYRRQYYPDADSPLEGESLALTGDQELAQVDFALRPAFFVDVTAASPGLARPLESSVYGLCWRDLDADGDPDLYAVPSSGRCRLLRNDRPQGIFVDRTLESGAAAGGLKTAVSAADHDNDGFSEIHLPRYGPFGSPFPDAMLQGGAAGHYRDAAVELGILNPAEGIDSCWADFDNNGFADLFVVNLFQPDALFLNTGDGRFMEVAGSAGVAGDVDESSAAAAPCDMDGDGLTDLLVVVDEFSGSRRKNHLYRNLGQARFEDQAHSAGLDGLSRSLCAAWGDADNDGDPDLFIGGVEYDTLLRNDGNGRFTDVSAASGLASSHTARGAAWVDVDLDGFLDLFIMRSGGAGNRLLLGGGDFSFHNLSIEAGLAESGQWTAFAWADHDLDGDPDLALADGSGQLRLLRNDLACATAARSPSWISLDLEGRAAPRDGTGSMVLVRAGLKTIVRSCGDLSAPRSKGDRRLLVGLGDFGGATVQAEIHWSSGTLQSAELPVNAHVQVVEAVPPTWIIAGTGQIQGNPAKIRCFLPGGREVTSARIVPFTTGQWGIETACGDLDGDGVDEILAAPGPSPAYAPHIRAFERLGRPLPGGDLLAFAHAGYGARIACGDMDGDGLDELAVSPGPGPAYGSTIVLYRYDASMPGWGRLSGVPPFLAYGPTVRGGAMPAIGDLDGDGIAELVTAPGAQPSNGSHIRGWSVVQGGVIPLPQVNFLAYTPGVGYGAVAACGDLDGDGRDELITAPGPGPGYGPHIRVWQLNSTLGGVVLVAEMLADIPGQGRGARIACGDLDGDGRDELVVSSGPHTDATSLIRAWRLAGSSLVRVEGVGFHAFGQYGGGAALAVGVFGETDQRIEK